MYQPRVPTLRAKEVKANVIAFVCPGCKCRHQVNVRNTKDPKGRTWGYNELLWTPAFVPEVVYEAGILMPGVCRSWVSRGRIAFSADSWHALRGQEVTLPAWTD